MKRREARGLRLEKQEPDGTEAMAGRSGNRGTASRLGLLWVAEGDVKEPAFAQRAKADKLASAGENAPVATGGRSRGKPTWRGPVIRPWH